MRRASGTLESSLIFIVSISIALSSAAMASPVCNYDVTLKGNGAASTVHASAWAPDNVPVRGMLYLLPGLGGDTRYACSYQQYQSMGQALGLGIIGLADNGVFPGAGATEARANVQAMLDVAATGLSRPQISNMPLAVYGFSKGGNISPELANYMPDRTICYIADKSGSWALPMTPQSAFVPGMFVAGSRDSVCGPPGPVGAFYSTRVWNGQVSLATDWGYDHQSTPRSLMASFIYECMSRRDSGQAISSVAGNPLPLNQLPENSGWLLDAPTCVVNALTVPANPEFALFDSYSHDRDLAAWTATQTIGKVLRAKYAADPTTGQQQVSIGSYTTPEVDGYLYAGGQTIQLSLDCGMLNPAGITGVRVFHEDQLIAELSSLSASATTIDYKLGGRGVHTFIVEADYLSGGQAMTASGYWVTMALPEPATLALIAVGGLALCRRRRNRPL